MLITEFKANVNCVNNHLETPIHRVADTGNISIINYLCENGADYERKDKFGKKADEYGNEDVEYVIEAKRIEVVISQQNLEMKLARDAHGIYLSNILTNYLIIYLICFIYIYSRIRRDRKR
jgi:ankyrin repeat protein